MKKAIFLTLFSLLFQLAPLQAVDPFRDLLATKYPKRFATELTEYDSFVRENKPLDAVYLLTTWKMRRITDFHEIIVQLNDQTNPRYGALQQKYTALPESERDRLGNQNIFTEDMGAMEASFGEWFQKRPAIKPGEGDVVIQARRALWRYKQLEMCGAVFKKFHADPTFNPKSASLDTYFIPLAQVKQGAPYYIFSEDFDQKMADGKVTFQKISSLATLEFNHFESLWQGTDIRPRYNDLIRAGKTHEADEHLKGRFIEKTIEWSRLGQGEEIVYHPGTPFEKRPTLVDLLAKLQRKYTQHRTNGTSKTEPVEGFEEFMGAAVELVGKTVVNTEIIERTRKESSAGLKQIDEMLAQAIPVDQAMKLIEAKRKIQEGMTLLEVDIQNVQDAWEKVWFTTSHSSLRAPTILLTDLQAQLDALPVADKDNTISTWNKAAWKQAVNVEADASLSSEEKSRRLRIQERAALAWWERRKNAGTFKAPEGSPDDVVAQYQWRDRTLFKAHKQAIMAGKPGTAMILWDHDFTRGTSTWEPNPLLMNMEMEAFRLFAKSKPSLSPQEVEEVRDRWNIATSDYILRLLSLARDIPARVSLPQILGGPWANSRALPRIFRDGLPVVQADTDAKLWNDSLTSFLHTYQVLSPRMGPQVGGHDSEIAIMMRYLCDVRDPDPITASLQGDMKNLYALWRTRSAAASFEGNRIGEFALFGQWIDSAAFTVSKIEPLLQDGAAPGKWNILNLDIFQKFFALEGDIAPNAPWRSAVERAREAWNQRAPQ